MFLCRILFILLILCNILLIAKCKQNDLSIEEVYDVNHFRRLVKTKPSLLVLFVSDLNHNASILKTFNEAANSLHHEGAMAMVDCSGEGKRLCKKLRLSPDSYIIRHYKGGEVDQNYDPKESVQSIVNFMKTPSGSDSWEDDPSAVNVTHVPDAQNLQRLIKGESRPVMVMFYAPWCNYCKKLKPEYAAVASEVKDSVVMAAIDADKPENSPVRVKHNITGYPTVLYFQNGELKHTYDGESKKDKLLEFIQKHIKKHKPRDAAWASKTAYIKHLNGENFHTFIRSEPSVLVLFYAPWCGHCKKMKPEYEKAAAKMKDLNIPGVLAAVDATEETSLASKYNVDGYPAIKYFSNGAYMFDVPGVRQADKLINFMKSPMKQEPVQIAPEEKCSAQINEVKRLSTCPIRNVEHLTTKNVKRQVKKKRHSEAISCTRSHSTMVMIKSSKEH